MPLTSETLAELLKAGTAADFPRDESGELADLTSDPYSENSGMFFSPRSSQSFEEGIQPGFLKAGITYLPNISRLRRLT